MAMSTWVHSARLMTVVWLVLLGAAAASERPVTSVAPAAPVPPSLNFFTLAPCRAVDTRSAGGPLLAGVERTFPLVGAPCGIPATAVAVSVNVAVTQPTSAGNVRLYPAGSAVPISSAINFAAGQTRTNNTVVGLGAGGVLAAQCLPAGSGSTHLIVDVNGYFAGTGAVVRINEINANITGSCDLIELRVVSGGSMGGYRLQERDNETLVTFSAGFTVATNDILVVHMNTASPTCNPGGATQETTSPFQQPAAMFSGNYDTAFDWWSSDTGLVSTDNVFTLYDAGNAIMDAVFVTDDPAGTAAAGTEAQAAVVAVAGQWQIVGGGVPPGGFVDDAFNANAALDLNATGTSASGTSIQRLDNTDDNDKNDWNSGALTTQPSTWGLLNAGQTPF